MKPIHTAMVVVIVVCLTAIYGLAHRPEIAPGAAPQRAAFGSALIQSGGVLAQLGDCIVCHTPAGAKVFSGGLPVATPFGTIFSTNITPDPETGIGRWSEAAFARAMRDGVSRDGHLLYPAFPYDHFTHVTDDDLHALYAFMMTREPVAAAPLANTLPFPFNLRPIIAGWNMLFLHKGPVPPTPDQSAEWNRGAYLVEGLGHCGACHTPRNQAGGESVGQAYAGNVVEQWHAPALNSDSPAPVPWTVDSMTTYLRRGWVDQHSVSAGPMQLVYHNLGDVPDADVRAIATYLVSVAGPVSPERARRAEEILALVQGSKAGTVAAVPAGETAGAAIFAGACSSCHQEGGPTLAGHLPLALYTAVTAPDPRNLIHVILDGVRPVDGEAGPIMPGFAGALTDEQVASLASYIRAHYTKQPAWTDLTRAVHDIRQGNG